MKNIPKQYHPAVRKLIKKARDSERANCLLRLEACLNGTRDVVNLDAEPPTIDVATIDKIQEHIQMHIDLVKEHEKKRKSAKKDFINLLKGKTK